MWKYLPAIDSVLGLAIYSFIGYVLSITFSYVTTNWFEKQIDFGKKAAIRRRNDQEKRRVEKAENYKILSQEVEKIKPE